MILEFRAWDKIDKKMIHWEQMKSEFTFGYFEDENLDFMQSTGLFDKKGVEIFEGDLVRLKYPASPDLELFKVIQSRSGLWKLDTPIMNNELWHLSKQCEAIGNIYENPELIKRKD